MITIIVEKNESRFLYVVIEILIEYNISTACGENGMNCIKKNRSFLGRNNIEIAERYHKTKGHFGQSKSLHGQKNKSNIER